MRALASTVGMLWVLAIAGCGGGGGGDTQPNGGTASPNVIGSSLPLPELLGGGGATEAGSTACSDNFTPERVIAGDNCDPDLNRARFCPLTTNYLMSLSTIQACSGVTISEHLVSGGGLNTKYVAIRRSSGTPKAVYLALHYLEAQPEYFANLTRLTELAKARDVLILMPFAPALVDTSVLDGSDLLGALPLPLGAADLTEGLSLSAVQTSVLAPWPLTTLQPIENYLQLLDNVVSDGRGRFDGRGLPLYVSSLSNGVPMAYFYACGRAERVDAVLAVAGAQSFESAAACQPSRPVGLVIVHGTLDPVAPYIGIRLVQQSPRETYDSFKRLNSCGGTDRQAQMVNDGGSVQIDFTPSCAQGRRAVLASANFNGHNWPGDDTNPALGIELPLGPFGPNIDAIDATIQGYDLLRYAAGS